ncbi:MAG: hypothetical protein HFH09_00255 [Bacilli bacterium]|jgi:hypothetical protein|nr:hypothetical protein [Bacilli bacterium]
MKKVILLLALLTLLTCVFLVTGCTMVRIDTDSIDNTINVILSKENKLYNRVGKGYKYYIPRGVIYIDTDEFNDKLYSNGNYYYLYIDAISYYYQKKVTYQKNEQAYYSKVIHTKDKDGYVEIIEQDKKYLIRFSYNYARIETLVDKKDINNVILNASYILSTVKFNHNVIKLMLDDEYFTNKEESYDLFNSTGSDFNDKKVVEAESDN